MKILENLRRKASGGTVGRVGVILAVMISFCGVLSCSPDENDAAGDVVDAVAVDLVVEQDDFLGFTKNAVIGDVWFSDSVGLVGTPVDVVVQIKEYQRIPEDVDLNCEIRLVDPSVTKVDEFFLDVVIDKKRVETDFIIPQVITIPTILEYEVTLSAVNPNDPTELFIARLRYQFLVNQGAPAT